MSDNRTQYANNSHASTLSTLRVARMQGNQTKAQLSWLYHSTAANAVWHGGWRNKRDGSSREELTGLCERGYKEFGIKSREQPANPGSPGNWPLKWRVRVPVCACTCVRVSAEVTYSNVANIKRVVFLCRRHIDNKNFCRPTCRAYL